MRIDRSDLKYIIGTTKNRKDQLKNLNQSERKTFRAMLTAFKENKDFKVPEDFQKSFHHKVTVAPPPEKNSNTFVKLTKRFFNKLGLRESSAQLRHEMDVASKLLEQEETAVSLGLYATQDIKNELKELQKELFTLSYSHEIPESERENKLKEFGVKVQNYIKEIEKPGFDPGMKKAVGEYVNKNVLQKVETRLFYIRQVEREKANKIDSQFNSLKDVSKEVRGGDGNKVLSLDKDGNLVAKPRSQVSTKNREKAIEYACKVLSDRIDLLENEYKGMNYEQKNELTENLNLTGIINRLEIYSKKNEINAGDKLEEVTQKYSLLEFKPLINFSQNYQLYEKEIRSCIETLFDHVKEVKTEVFTLDFNMFHKEYHSKINQMNLENLTGENIKILNRTKTEFVDMCKALAKKAKGKLQTTEAADRFNQIKKIDTQPISGEETFTQILSNLQWFAEALEKQTSDELPPPPTHFGLTS